MLGYSQYDGKNELKVNFMYLLLGLPEISYERTLKPNTSIGISAAFSSEKNNELEIRKVKLFRKVRIEEMGK